MQKGWYATGMGQRRNVQQKCTIEALGACLTKAELKKNKGSELRFGSISWMIWRIYRLDTAFQTSYINFWLEAILNSTVKSLGGLIIEAK